MKLTKYLLILLIFCTLSVNAQQNYRVFFRDKDGSTFDPYSYFDAKAIERRIVNNISLYDITDFPVNENYISQVSSVADSVLFVSRWFNMAYVDATVSQIEKIKEFSFVTTVEPVLGSMVPAMINPEADYDSVLSSEESVMLINQTARMGGELFTQKNIDGKGLRIAIFDAGFPTVDVNPAFEHIRRDGRILKTWDFTRNKEFVYSFNSHGCMVMSCIGGMINGRKIGLATGAEFMLARTEVNSEPYSEEKNWLAAVEWADKNGADIINSSLGYTFNRYFNDQMDGKTSLVARAANLAARKGILVINAAGNEGSSKWKFIGTPADADSIISAGGIDPDTDYHISFSSYGPTSDKRMKPNISAYGSVIAAGKTGLSNVQGTSFASPLIAGFAACAWQVHRDRTNMQMFDELQKSGDLYPYFDYAHGYGVPQASWFVNGKTNALPTFNITTVDSNLVIVTDTINDNHWPGKQGLLYYKISDSKGFIEEYYVISVYQQEALKIPLKKYSKGKTLTVFYRGYAKEFTF
ncbi:MAG: S8 family serine peptidase [Bacteroidota bacterium]